MNPNSSSDKSKLLSDLSQFVYGTTRLGDEKFFFEDRVNVARAAMQSGVWFHTSHTYGNALDFLRTAFDQDRSNVPNLIIKIGWNDINELRNVIHQNIDPLGVESLSIGQLCLGGQLAEEFANGGNCYREFEEIKRSGLVKRFVVEVFPWTSQMSLKAIRGGYTEGIVDGFIFYLNPLQRFASNELWDLFHERNEPMIAMRTVSGGPVHSLRDIPGFAWKEYLQKRAVEIAPIFEKSRINSWTEFCVRFAHSFPLVRTTVGSTARVEYLNEYLTAIKQIEPLPKEIVEEIVKLQYRWSNETDLHAELWSM